ncbi:NADPH-dependent methylglyoxal reductase GRE2 [Termitomyces sp. T112]|nr:NADPH-dependent methylglyoxal reductase GRE2 [Termitomyces sp. T112]
MPTVTPGDKILVSGANGYIAIWVVRRFLEKGYAVRGTVRSADKGKYLEEYFKSYSDKFEIVVVQDITKEGAFDEMLLHTQRLRSTWMLQLYKPAVNGTVSILKSAQKNGSNVKRVVMTSSAASVLEIGVDKIFTEANWNELAVREVKEQGDAAHGMTKYRASKTLAEKAAWEFYNTNKANLKWDLSILNPPFVFGPAIHELESPDALNTSLRQWYDAVLGNNQNETFLKVQGSAYIDVRDVAEAHTLALEKEAAGGERIIISAGSYVWQDWLDVARSLSPSPIPSHPDLPVGFPGAGATAKPPVRYDTSKAQRILGLKYRTKVEVTRDTLADFERRGW